MTGKLTLTPVTTPAEREEFIRFQWEIYRNDPDWVPPLLSERREFMDPARHPFHEHAEVQSYIARRDGRPVGRISAIINHRHNEHWNERVGFFGLYEVVEGEHEASKALLAAAEDYVRDAGMTAIRGPMNFSTNEEIGLLVEGWNGPPVVMMTYNPRYYVEYIEAAGYAKAMDVFAYLADLRNLREDGTGMNPRLLRVAQKVQERYNFTVRPINMRNFDEEKQRVKQVYNAAWAKNWGFVPLTVHEMDHLGEAIKTMIDPKTVFFAEKDGEPIAFMIPFLDLCQPLLKAYPRPGVPEWWTLLKLGYWWKVRKNVTRLRAAVGGIIEEYRGRGVDAVLFMETLKAGIRGGYEEFEISWVLENNIPMRQTAENFGGEQYRTYRIYEKSL